MEKSLTIDETFLLRGPTPELAERDKLRVAAFQQKSYISGPGVRAVLWVAGCMRRCPGCSLPEFFSFSAGQTMVVEELARRVIAIPGLDGVTYSGGEPFEHVQPLAKLSGLLRDAGLTIASYSGYARRALEADVQRFGPLLRELDILIDGEFRRELAGSFLWRGSSNQKIHFLRDEVSSQPLPKGEVRLVQISFADKSVQITGFVKDRFAEELAAQLDRRGIAIEPVRS